MKAIYYLYEAIAIIIIFVCGCPPNEATESNLNLIQNSIIL